MWVLSVCSVRRLAVFAVAFLMSVPLGAAASDVAGTIYDSKLLERMEFSDGQVPRVKEILEASEAEMAIVFEKYGIDPNAKPEFDRLRAASTELQDIEAREKRAMKAILSKEQYADYLEILQGTTALVIKATRND
jgi:hypothetical protein